MKSKFILLPRILIAALLLTLAPSIASAFDEKPSVLKTVSPKNPDGASGMVLVTIEIDEKGFVIAADVTKSTDDALNSLAVSAVEQWRFNPAKKEGVPVTCKIKVPFKF